MSPISLFASSLGLSFDIELDSSTGIPVAGEDEEMKASMPNVFITCGSPDLDADGASAAGILFITTRRVVWVSDPPAAPSSEARTSVALSYPQIVIHAISRDPKPCIYLQLDDDSEGDFIGAADGAQALAEEAEEEEEAEEVTPELRIVPSDPSVVEEIFRVLCECAALNPDPQGEDDEGEFYFDEDEVIKGLDEGTRAALLASRAEGMELDEGAGEELEELVGDDPGRFEGDEEEMNGN